MKEKKLLLNNVKVKKKKIPPFEQNKLTLYQKMMSLRKENESLNLGTGSI